MIQSVKTYIVIDGDLYDNINEAIYIAQKDRCVVDLILGVNNGERLEIFIYETDTVMSAYKRYDDYIKARKKANDQETT